MTKTFAKTLVIFAGIILITLFVIGIVETFVLQSLKAQQESLLNDISNIEQQVNYISTSEYEDGYIAKENGVGNENDKIYR